MNVDHLFRTVTDVETKLRAFVFGPAGSGKTTTALQIALGLADGDATTVCLLDSEHGSAAKAGRDLDAGFAHADVDAFRRVLNRADLVDFDPRTYDAAIREASKRYDVVIVDSLSHAWEATCNIKDAIGDSWGSWKTVTPIWRALIETILTVDAHVICTGRAKTKREMSTDRGKRDLKIVGVVPMVRENTDYEFDVVLRMTDTHTAIVEKARSTMFNGAHYDRPGPELGREFAAWLSKGGEDPAVWLARELAALGIDPAQLDAWRAGAGRGPMADLAPAQQRQTVAWLASNAGTMQEVRATPVAPSTFDDAKELLGRDDGLDAQAMFRAAAAIKARIDGGEAVARAWTWWIGEGRESLLAVAGQDADDGAEGR